MEQGSMRNAVRRAAPSIRPGHQRGCIPRLVRRSDTRDGQLLTFRSPTARRLRLSFQQESRKRRQWKIGRDGWYANPTFSKEISPPESTSGFALGGSYGLAQSVAINSVYGSCTTCLHLFLPVLTFSLLVSPFRSTQSRSPKWSLAQVVINTLHFRGLALQSPGVSSQVRRILSFIPRSLNIRSLLFYLSNVCPSVDLLAVPLNYVLHKARYQPIASDRRDVDDISRSLPSSSRTVSRTTKPMMRKRGKTLDGPSDLVFSDISLCSRAQLFRGSRCWHGVLRI